MPETLTHYSENVSPEILQALLDTAAPDMVEDSLLLLDIESDLSRLHDLLDNPLTLDEERSRSASSQIEVLEAETARCIEALLENPYEGFEAEFLTLLKLCQGRSTSYDDTFNKGCTVIEFATRNAERTDVDLLFKARLRPDGSLMMYAQVPLPTENYSNIDAEHRYYRITADSRDESIDISQPFYKGYWQEKTFQAGKDDYQIHNRLGTFFAYSKEAEVLSSDRDGTERLASDMQSAHLLGEYQRRQRLLDARSY